jgi:hypothetical protein
MMVGADGGENGADGCERALLVVEKSNLARL